MLDHTPSDAPGLPDWCRTTKSLVGRAALVARVRDALHEGPVTLVGEAGVGTTAVGAAVLEALAREGIVGRLAAWRAFEGATLADASLVLGRALDGDLPGDEGALERLLRKTPAAGVLLDDADLAPEVVRDLVARGGPTRFVLTGRALVAGRAFGVTPLGDSDLRTLLPPGTDPRPYGGRPLLAMLPRPPTVNAAWAALDALPAGSELYAEIPMGVARDPGAIAVPFRLDRADRLVLRRSVREALGADRGASATALAAVLRDRLDALHRIACDRDPAPPSEDLALLRIAASRVVDPELRSLAAAAAARLSLRSFRPDEALRIVSGTLLRPLPPAARGLLRWLEGDALWEQGAEKDAREAWMRASVDLRAGEADAAIAALARRCAEHETARGDAQQASQWIDTARDALGFAPDAVALADTKRLAGDLALRTGDLLSAAARYDEAATALSRLGGWDPAIVAVALGRAAVATARGHLDRALEELNGAEARASDPRQRAAIAWRRAEIALRRGDGNGVLAEVRKARRDWREIGCLDGLARCARMEGDVAALRGDRVAARHAWEEALRLTVRQRDLGAVRRLLVRILVVEREGAPGPHLAEVEERALLAGVVVPPPRSDPA